MFRNVIRSFISQDLRDKSFAKQIDHFAFDNKKLVEILFQWLHNCRGSLLAFFRFAKPRSFMRFKFRTSNKQTNKRTDTNKISYSMVRNDFYKNKN